MKNMQIITAGESLVDLIKTNEGGYVARLGGSPYNCSLALAMLDKSSLSVNGGKGISAGKRLMVSFACPFSDDNFGGMFIDSLASHNIKPLLRGRSLLPSGLAVASTDKDGKAIYSFYTERVAYRDLNIGQIISALPEKIAVFHCGSLSIASDPDASVWHRVALEAKNRGALISLDPNIRFAGDSLSRLKPFLEIADIVKASDEDIDHLFPNICNDDDKIRAALAEPFNIQLLVVTRGESNISAYSAGQTIKVPAYRVRDMQDTIGAGDCFNGALLYYLMMTGNEGGAGGGGSEGSAGSKGSEGSGGSGGSGVSGGNEGSGGSEGSGNSGRGLLLRDISEVRLREALDFAARGAAINCGRAGCAPATLQEILNFKG